jgi:WD40 repeat protein
MHPAGENRIALKESGSPTDAFISYSHAADGELAPAIERALEQIAKPWYRRRSLSVFRDTTGLAVNPHLWSSICTEIDASRKFILLASPQAAASQWVGRELERWLETKSPDDILIVLTDGDLMWDQEANDFDGDKSSALPPVLYGGFSEQPLYLDLSWARSETQLDLQHPRFRDEIARLAAAIHGAAPDDLIGEDIRQRRRALRLAWGAAVGLLGLLAASLVLGALAFISRNDALAQSRLATAKAAAAATVDTADSQPDVAYLLGLESFRLANTPETRSALSEVLMRTDSVAGFLRGNESNVREIEFAADGRTLASAAHDTVRVWDVTHRRVAEEPLVPGGGVVLAVAVSPDGRYIATTGQAGAAHVWTRAGKKLGSFTAVKLPLLALGFDGRGKRLAVGWLFGVAAVWDLASGEIVPLSSREDETFEITNFAFSPDGRTVAASSNDGTIRVWSSTGGRALTEPLRHGRRVADIEFAPDGRTLWSAGADGAVRAWRVGSWQAAGEGLLHPKAVLALRFADRSSLETVTADGVVRTWSTATRKPTRRSQPLPGFVSGEGATALGEGGMVASGDRFGSVRLWRTSGRADLGVRVDSGTSPYERPFAFDASGEKLAIGVVGGVEVWSARTGRMRTQLHVDGGREFGDEIQALAFSRDGRSLAWGEYDGDIRLWDVEKAKQIGDPLQHRKAIVRDLEFSPDGLTLASAGASTVLLWSLDHRQRAPVLLATGFTGVQAVEFIDDGQRLIAVGGRGAEVWEVAAAQRVERPFRGLTYGSAALSGARLVVVADDQRLRQLDVAKGVELGSPLRLAEETRSVALSPDGAVLARVMKSGDVRLTDLASGQDLGPVLRWRDADSVAFGPDSETLAVRATDGSVRLWSPLPLTAAPGAATLTKIQARICMLAARNLDKREWARYFGKLGYHKTCPDG